jgi:hypothetical protein
MRAQQRACAILSRASPMEGKRRGEASQADRSARLICILTPYLAAGVEMVWARATFVHKPSGGGVDKQIDLLSLAIQKRMTVFDLEEAELAQAPQFGSAKGSINMTGLSRQGCCDAIIRR